MIPNEPTTEPLDLPADSPADRPSTPLRDEPAAARGPVAVDRPRHAAGTIVAAAVLAAVVASGGTYGLLRASGALDQTPTQAAPVAANVVQTVVTKPAITDASAAIEAVVTKVGPAVVTITSTVSSSRGSGGSQTGVGSGIIVASDGWILTNNHVIAGASSLQVTLTDGRSFSGTVGPTDAANDLAMVKIAATGLPTATLGDSSALVPGQLVVAIGDPLGTFTNTVTSGIVSALGRTITVEGRTLSGLVQTDAAINPGNSGGPLLDAAGNVIAIDTAEAGSAEGIGFAIPSNTAAALVKTAVSG
jgi:S1-C subfamily serine protease